MCCNQADRAHLQIAVRDRRVGHQLRLPESDGGHLRRAAIPARRSCQPAPLPGGARDIRGDDICGMPVQAAAGPVVPHRGSRISVRCGFLDIARRDPRIQRGRDERMSERVRCNDLGDPARRAALRTIRPAPCRSSRRPSAARNTGPPVRSAMARSIARDARGASGMVTTLPLLRVIVSVRCPRSRPRYSMSAPVASETRSPFSASWEISACSAAA